MKTKTIAKWSAGLLMAATLASAGSVPADQTAASTAKDKEFKGMVERVNNQEHTLTVGGWLRHRTFDLGNHCVVTRWNNTAGNINDLQPGQEVTVGYQDVSGVMAASRVEQEAMRCEGIVKMVDPEQRQMVLYKWDHDRKFTLAGDCKIVLHDNGNGTFASIKPGDHVTVVYEKPAGGEILRQISQTSASFTGSVVAIDLTRRTVSTEDVFGVKLFDLAKDCSIVMDGRIDAPLKDVRPGQRLTINYDEINGVNVANRIAPVEGSHEAAAAQASR